MVTNLSTQSSSWSSIENDKGMNATFCIDGITYEVSRLFVDKEIISQSKKRNQSSPSSPTTIWFRVGGVSFEVSRSLVEGFPTTILYRLLSESMNTLTNANEGLFVQCNRNRFEYIIEYMMFGKVCLPDSIPKEVLLRDLKYLGFENVNESDIKSHSEAALDCAVPLLDIFLFLFFIFHKD